MKIVTVTLGGKDYEIRQLPSRPSKEWRQKFGGPFETLVGALQFAGDAIGKEIDSNAAISQIVSGVGQVLIGGISDVLIGSMDTITDMLFSYSPELAKDRERIETEGYDDEIVTAFWEVVKLAYPFGELISAIRGQRKL